MIELAVMTPMDSAAVLVRSHGNLVSISGLARLVPSAGLRLSWIRSGGLKGAPDAIQTIGGRKACRRGASNSPVAKGALNT